MPANGWPALQLFGPQPLSRLRPQETETGRRGVPQRGRSRREGAAEGRTGPVNTTTFAVPAHPHPARAYDERKQTLLVAEIRSRRAQAAGWAGAALLVVGLHLGGAFFLTRTRAPETVAPDEMGAIMIELAPEVQRAASQVDAALAKPEEQAAEPVPPEPAPPEEAVEPEPTAPEAPVEAIAPLPPPKEVPKPDRKKPAPRKPLEHKRVEHKPLERKPQVRHRPALRTASAPRSEQHAATTAAASAGAASAQSSADWKSLVAAALNRHKRFPSGVALSGSPTLRVAIAASGQVTAATVIASSGSPDLDDAAIQTVRRASPLPPPPAGSQTLTFRMNFRPR